MIELKNISKTFGKKNNAFKALNNISLNVEEGDIVGIIGFSGAGKSTLIRTVNLLETPDSGKCLSTEQILPACHLPNFLRKEKRLGWPSKISTFYLPERFLETLHFLWKSTQNQHLKLVPDFVLYDQKISIFVKIICKFNNILLNL